MAFRIWKKSVKMILRDKRTFVVFCLMYTGLIFINSWFFELALNPTTSAFGNVAFLGAFAVSLTLAILYAWLIVSRNRRNIATYKCIGWTNRNVNSLVLGQIIFTTVMGMLIVIEGLFHYNAIVVYVLSVINPIESVESIPFITLVPVVVSCGVFIVIQLLGYFIMKSKITKVRPMVALKRIGE